MTGAPLVGFTLAAALGSALMAGFFFAFSVVTMTALGRLPPEQGITAMQSINVVVLNGRFFSVFFGTAAACFGLAIYALSVFPAPAAVYLLLGSGNYISSVSSS